MSHFEIRVGDVDETPVFNVSQNALCHYEEADQPLDSTVQYHCSPDPLKGRYVSITKSPDVTPYMTLCEVQAFASGRSVCIYVGM